MTAVKGRRNRLTAGVAAAAKSARGVNSLDSVSLSQLRLGDLHLHGRDDDLKLLKLKLRQLTNENGEVNKSEHLFITGTSGTGKSALVMRGLRDQAQKMDIAFAGGKFDQNNTTKIPFSAVVDALSSLIKYVMEHANAQKIRDEINRVLRGEEKQFIARSMPGCDALLSISNGGGRRSNLSILTFRGGGEESSHGQKYDFGEGGQDSSYRLQYLIRILVKIICSNLKGVVLFIDDMQWGDVATLDLLRSLSLDQSILSLMLVGAYREDEVTEFHHLAIHLRGATQLGLEIVIIKVGNLSYSAVKSLIADALRMEDHEDEVEPLATLIFKKTEGNAFFVLTFLRSLYDEELLQYNFGVMKWSWDINVIKEKWVTQNVATVMLEKLKRLKEVSQSIMKIASCLGATFSPSTATIVVQNMSSSETILDLGDGGMDDGGMNALSSISNSMREFENEGLWESVGHDSCRFSHDQIQMAAFQLIPSEQRDSFRGEIGDILLNKLDPMALEETFFQAVSLKNCGAFHLSEDERKELARMNLYAGLKAYGNAAFTTAVVYFKEARGLLGPKAWENDHDSMLQLCNKEAQARFITGDIDAMHMLIEEVLGKDIASRDKFVAFEVKIRAAQSADRLDEAISMALEFRKKLGLRAPANRPVSKLTLFKEYTKTNRIVNGRTAEEIAELPELTCERVIMGQKMLEHLHRCTVQAQPTLYPIITFMGVQESIKHGINDSSIPLFNSFGFILCGIFGQLKRGYEMANAAELMLENPGMNHKKSRGIVGFEIIRTWRAPIQLSLQPLLEGYQLGLEVGDIEAAGLNLYVRCTVLWFAGRPLKGVEKELETSVCVLAEINQEGPRLLVLACLLAARKLSGNSTPLRASLACNEGETMEDLLLVASEIGNNYLLGHVALVQIELIVFYHNWEAAKNLLIKFGDLRQCFRVFYQAVRYTFLKGLICLKTAQSAKSYLDRRKWKKRAQKAMKLMRTWLKKGNVNVVHSMHLLNAEYAVLKGNETDAKEMFKAAAAVAARNGSLQDKGLAHELAGEYFVAHGDEYWAKFNMDRAHQSYSDWQAHAKAEDLSERRNSLFGTGLGIEVN